MKNQETMKKPEFEFELPVEMIQLIQSFLSPKESVQSSLISRPWFNAWETSPSLHLNEQDFVVDGVVSFDAFWFFARKCMERYKKLHRKLDWLFIRLNSSLTTTHIPFLDGLITDALRLGVNELGLETSANQNYVLPTQLFEPNSLTELSVVCGVISPELLLDRTLCCSRLTSLELSEVRNSDRVVEDVIHTCLLIEKLKLHFCNDLNLNTKVDLSGLDYLVELSITGGPGVRVQFNNHGRIHEFRWLIRIEMSRVKLDNDFLKDFSSKFPCIRELDLEFSPDIENIRISCQSIRLLSLFGNGLDKVQLEVPNVLSLLLGTANRIPRLCFVTPVASRGWKCGLTLNFTSAVLDDCCLSDLKKLLRNFCLSTMSLNMAVLADSSVSTGLIPFSFSVPVLVESLRLIVSRTGNPTNLLRGLLWTCRPSIILAYEMDTWQFLYEQLIKNDDIYNLQKVYLEQRFDDSEWQIIPSQNVNASEVVPYRIRFRLSWEGASV